MKSILLVVASAAIAVFLSFGAATSDAHPHSHPSIRINVNVRGGHSNYLSQNYRGFRSTCYLPSYRTNLFFDPVSRTWFFYSPTLRQFMPLALISQYSPLTGGMGVLPPGFAPGAPGFPMGGVPMLPPGAVPFAPAQPVTPMIP